MPDPVEYNSELVFRDHENTRPTTVYIPWQQETLEKLAENRGCNSPSELIRELLKKEVATQAEKNLVTVIS